jgi:hypothetical protein
MGERGEERCPEKKKKKLNWRTHSKYFLLYFENHDLYAMLFVRCWYDLICMMFDDLNDDYEILWKFYNVTNMFVMIHKNAHAMLYTKIMSSMMICLWNIYARNLLAQMMLCLWKMPLFRSIIMMMLWLRPDDVLWVDYMVYDSMSNSFKIWDDCSSF